MRTNKFRSWCGEIKGNQPSFYQWGEAALPNHTCMLTLSKNTSSRKGVVILQERLGASASELHVCLQGKEQSERTLDLSNTSRPPALNCALVTHLGMGRNRGRAAATPQEITDCFHPKPHQAPSSSPALLSASSRPELLTSDGRGGVQDPNQVFPVCVEITS